MPESSFFDWLTYTDVALYLRQSPYLIGFLSSIHLLGLTLIGGSGIVFCLRGAGIFLPDRPFGEIMKPAGRGTLAGFGLALASGLFLFMPRAASAVQTPAFQVKMAFVLAAAAFHFGLYSYQARKPALPARVLSLASFLGLALWLGVAFAGFAFAVFN